MVRKCSTNLPTLRLAAYLLPKKVLITYIPNDVRKWGQGTRKLFGMSGQVQLYLWVTSL